MTRSLVHHPRHASRGTAAVEFALVSTVFFTLLFMVMEAGRLMYYWNSAAEITRLGARMAVVCDPNTTSRNVIATKMRQLLPIVVDSTITVTRIPAGCDDSTAANTCQAATVSIVTTTPITSWLPLVPVSVVMPAFTTTLTRESMQSTFAGVTNPICQ
jgi:Flp pilus assembly protein TadG